MNDNHIKVKIADVSIDEIYVIYTQNKRTPIERLCMIVDICMMSMVEYDKITHKIFDE